MEIVGCGFAFFNEGVSEIMNSALGFIALKLTSNSVHP